MNVVLLAGGFGTRIMPLTHYLPKPMLPVANTPAIDYMISLAAYSGASRIILTVAYKSQLITAFTNGYVGLNIESCREIEPLGTAGGVKNARPTGDFAVLSGDAVSNVNLAAMMKFHKSRNAAVTIAAKHVDNLTSLGKLVLNGDQVVAICEKDKSDEGKSGVANIGIYIIAERVLDYINGTSDFARDLFPMLIARGEKISAFMHDGYWRDIGGNDSYLAANIELMSRKLFPEARHVDRCKNTWTETSLIGEHAIVCGRIHRCVIGESAVVCSNAQLTDCVVLPGAFVSGNHENEIVGSKFCYNVSNPTVNLNNIRNLENYYC